MQETVAALVKAINFHRDGLAEEGPPKTRVLDVNVAYNKQNCLVARRIDTSDGALAEATYQPFLTVASDAQYRRVSPHLGHRDSSSG